MSSSATNSQGSGSRKVASARETKLIRVIYTLSFIHLFISLRHQHCHQHRHQPHPQTSSECRNEIYLLPPISPSPLIAVHATSSPPSPQRLLILALTLVIAHGFLLPLLPPPLKSITCFGICNPRRIPQNKSKFRRYDLNHAQILISK